MMDNPFGNDKDDESVILIMNHVYICINSCREEYVRMKVIQFF